MNVFKRRMMESKIEYDNAAKAIQEAIDLEGIVARRSNCWNAYREAQIRFSNIEQKEIKMQKMTRKEALQKIKSCNPTAFANSENMLNTLEALGLIEFEKEKYYINLISNNNYYQFTFKEMQDALANYGYQIVKKREPIIDGPVLVYLSELSRNVSFKCLKDALACYGLIVVKSTNECGKPSVNLEPNCPGL